MILGQVAVSQPVAFFNAVQRAGFQPGLGTSLVHIAFDKACNRLQTGASTLDRDSLFTIRDLPIGSDPVRLTVQTVDR